MLEARLDMERSIEFKQRLDEVIDGGAAQIVLDLSRVTYIDSSGPRLRGLGVQADADRGFHVTGLRPNVRMLFQITRLDKFINVYATVDEALATFGRA